MNEEREEKGLWFVIVDCTCDGKRTGVMSSRIAKTELEVDGGVLEFKTATLRGVSSGMSDFWDYTTRYGMRLPSGIVITPGAIHKIEPLPKETEQPTT